MPTDREQTFQEPKAWIDEHHVVRIRSDVPLLEARELDAMLGAAFNAGTKNGWEQAMRRMREESGAFPGLQEGLQAGLDQT